MIVVVAIPADQSKAERITAALLNGKLDVQLQILDADPQERRSSIEAALTSRCALFCWSAQSATDENFCSLAAHAVRNGIAIGVLLERNASAPTIAPMTTYPLQPWQLGTSNRLALFVLGDRFLRDVVTAAANKAAGLDPPAPANRAQVARDSIARLLTVAGGTIITLGGLKQAYDYIPWPHPAEDRAWAAIQPGTPEACNALQAFVRDFPGSDRVAEAQAALSHPQKTHRLARQQHAPYPLADALGVPDPQPSEVAAQAALDERLALGAKDLCEDVAAQTEGHVVTDRVQDSKSSCTKLADGWVCTGGAKAICTVDEPVTINVCVISRSD